MLILGSAPWIACSILSYLIGRRLYRLCGSYTVGDRTFNLVVSMLGPLSLFATIVWYAVWNPDKRKASW